MLPNVSRERLQATDALDELKPLLRGWSHALAAVISVGLTVALGVRSYDDPIRLLSLLVFGVSTIQLYAVSAIFHIGSWRGRRYAMWRTLDHASIFVVIAGTYTPFCVNVMSGWQGPAVLVLIWILAFGGVALTLATPALQRRLMVPLCVGMGWLAVVPGSSVAQVLPLPAVATLIGGGLLYTIGAIIFASQRPDPYPRIFGFHELFHLFVVAGNAAFFAAIWIWVLPFPRP